MTFKSDIDMSQVLSGVAKGGTRGLRLATEHLLAEANRRVPHEDGDLERSGEASVSGKRGAVSWDTPYAVRQHEDMDLHHDGKGEAKWAENTLTSERSVVGQLIAQAVRSELGG